MSGGGRVVQMLGLAEIRAEVQPRTDGEARRIVLVSAVQCRDLNVIEQARAMQALLSAGDVAGPTELGKLLGVSQGQVSNTLLVLLRLPDAWQAKIISDEIPHTWARHLVPWADRPAVLEAVAKTLRKRKPGQWPRPSENAAEFAGFLPSIASRTQAARLIAAIGTLRSTTASRRSPPTPEQTARLEIIEVENADGETVFDRHESPVLR